MQKRKIFILFLLIFISINIAAVSAHDLNSTDTVEMNNDEIISMDEQNTPDAVENDVLELNGESSDNNISAEENITVEKTTPKISLSTTKVKSKDSLEIYLLNSTGSPLKSKKITAILNNKKYTFQTNSKGYSKLNINLPAKSYQLKVTFEGDDNFNEITKQFTISVSKLKTRLTESANFIVKKDYLYFHLTDSQGNSVSGKRVTIKFNGKTYSKKTKSNGKVSIKIKSSKAKNTIRVYFKGDNQFKSTSKKLKFYVIQNSLSVKLSNSKFLTKGYIRIYLKNSGKALHKKTIILTVGSKKLKLKTNSEGIAIFKPGVKEGHYVVKAKYGKYYTAKLLKCYEGNVKDPLKEGVKYKNGKPDVDLMPGNYVMGDDNARYTLKKSQYKEVLKRDSYCLFLNDKLPKYTFFKTSSHPKLNHIIKREKWNVIERAINAKLVTKNKKGYWPGKITVSLKGKSYKYPFVRDSQNTAYTCGPTSCSMCSQVLKNYVCEKYLSKLAGTKSWGTSCDGMIKALAKNNFKATYFYKSTFSDALNELKKGGSALVFHANNHYVSVLDISKDGKKVLVSNSYGSYDGIPTKWVKVSFMKKKFSPKWTESLLVKLDYKLSDSTKNSINSYYTSMGKNWVAKNTHASIGRV
ncbi:cysteine peptidase family C39 domain-containing protein [Methanobrevibacter sp.]